MASATAAIAAQLAIDPHAVAGQLAHLTGIYERLELVAIVDRANDPGVRGDE